MSEKPIFLNSSSGNVISKYFNGISLKTGNKVTGQLGYIDNPKWTMKQRRKHEIIIARIISIMLTEIYDGDQSKKEPAA